MQPRPTVMQSSSAKIWGKNYELGFKPLRQDHSNGGSTADLQSKTVSPVIAFPPPPQVPASTINSRLPQSRPDPRELLPSSSHAHTVSSRNVKVNLPPEAMLQGLSRYVTKDGDYPAARGGFGEIWKCTFGVDHSSVKVRLPSFVAVKALQVYADDQLGAAKTKKNKRIMRELKLNHPNILRILGYTYDFGPLSAIVSPWAENGNLTVYLEREGVALTCVRRFRLLRDIIAGLQYLHANNVVPNVLIHGDGTACVADFGLSLMYSEFISASQASWTSVLKGNVRWMAPELL
ncbi:kinase-like domain-containing protein, partial [Suillus spraguei]